MAGRTVPTRRTPAPLPARFVPEFWGDADGRNHVVKEVRRRYELLKADAGADSYQKDLLVQRAVFMSLRLETLEVQAANTGQFDAGVYTQMVNSLHGVLRALGLERRVRKVGLKEYLAEGGRP